MPILQEILLSSSFFLISSLIMFGPLEWLIPARTRISRPPLGDWIHFCINPALGTTVALTVIFALGEVIRSHLPVGVLTWTHSQPVWFKLVLVVLLAELWSYWAHRLAHRIPFLWRFHRVHHSVDHLTWISALRQHPL